MNSQSSPEQLKQEFDNDGFVVIRSFLDPLELGQLQANLERYIRDVIPTLPPTAAFYQDSTRPETLKQMQHMQGDAYFRDYVKQPKWVALAETLVGESVNCESPEWFNKPCGTEHPTPPHQDNYYFCLVPSNVVTIWLALDEVDDENGCLRYVVGSHRKGLRPHGPSRILGFSQSISDFDADDENHSVSVHLHPGDAVAHHGETIHFAAPNRSTSRNRRAFAMVFEGRSARRDPQLFQRYQHALKQQHKTLGIN